MTKLSVEETLIKIVKKRKLVYFGHIFKRDNLQRSLLKGTTNCKRRKGRKRTMWINKTKEWTKLRYNKSIRMAQDRDKWQSMTVDALRANGT